MNHLLTTELANFVLTFCIIASAILFVKGPGV